MDVSTLSAALDGHYVIEREIGRGGMATVYLARDLKHDRRVALKVLDPELGSVLGAARFLAEIKVTANLQHPNLLPLFDSGAASLRSGQGDAIPGPDLLYYVMPYVEGETLRARLDREKQLPVDDAVRITTAIASALEYAHAHGVVHRDLKPENVLFQAGQPIVADFGIALAVSNAGGKRLTQTGISLGTPTYMSPEQATGDRGIDGRSDVYALGVMTYEMLVGDPPHTGSTAQAIIAKLITERPVPVRDARPSVPEHVDAAIQRALEKLPADRWPSAGDFRDALLGRLPTAQRPTATKAARRMPATMWALAAIPAIACAVLLFILLREKRQPMPAFRFAIPGGLASPTVWNPGYLAVSPDGSSIAFIGRGSTARASLWIRRLDSTTAREVAGTAGAIEPFWSRDGKSIAFFAAGKLKRVDLNGTSPMVLCEAGDSPLGGTWMDGDEIVFSRGGGALLRVSSRGGTPVPVTHLDSARAEVSHIAPDVLADGRHFVYWSVSYLPSAPATAVFVASLDGGVAKLVIDQPAGYAPPNHLLIERDGDIKAVEFDQKRLELRGDPVTVVSGESLQWMSASPSGVLVYTSEPPPFQTSLELLDRTGRIVRQLGAPKAGVGLHYLSPRLSPDGRVVVYEHHLGQGGGDLFTTDILTGRTVRQTFDPTTHNSFAVWSPDGKRIAYSSTRSGGGDVFVKTVGATDDRPFLPTSPANTVSSDWSRDGKLLLFDRLSPNTLFDVWMAPVGGGAPTKLLATSANEMQATFSPDGRWIAYASDEENGRFEVFVRPFPLNRQLWKVSTNGGEAPRWRRDGKELFYLAPTDSGYAMMSSMIETGQSFQAAPPKELFRRPIWTTAAYLRSAIYYDVTPDGMLFPAVLVHNAESAEPFQFKVFVNWQSALGKH